MLKINLWSSNFTLTYLVKNIKIEIPILIVALFEVDTI